MRYLLSKLKRKLFKIFYTFFLDHFLKTNSCHEPQTLDDVTFHRLQLTTPPRVFEYEYDQMSLWKRASQRGMEIIAELQKMQVLQIGRVLETGTGDGCLGVWLDKLGLGQVLLTDLKDWRCQDAKYLDFVQSKLEEGLKVPDNYFKLIISFNSFEHFENPSDCLNVMLDKLSPKGIIYADFGPLYRSPWGLHAYRTINFPYPQFLFSEQILTSKLHQLGIEDLGTERTELQPMNKWGFDDFDRLFNNTQGVSVLDRKVVKDYSQLKFVFNHRNAFSGRGLSLNDLVTSNYRVILQKQ